MGTRVSQPLVVALLCAGAATFVGCKVEPPGNGSKGPGPDPAMAGAAPGTMGGAGPGAMTGAPAVPGMVGMPGAMAPPGAMPGTVMVPPMPPMPPPGQPVGEMPPAVLALLSSRCAGCHTYGQADPSGWGSVLDVSRMMDADIIVPGRPEESRMIDRVAVTGNMPPKGPKLTPEEITLLKGWITDLKRPLPQAPPSDEDILDLIAGDQLALRGRSADYRYVSFAHYAGQGRPDGEMGSFRQVLSFVLNSLSRRGAIAELTTIDPQQSIFRVNLVDLGWNAQLWDTLTSFYPYCLESDSVAHQALYDLLDTEAPVVRGDWLLATATKAPLYDLLLDLPNTVDQLAARLGININDDINHPGLEEPDNLLRIGFRRSSVALHNRLVERHLGEAGQYLWLTYDFDSSQGRQDLMANPLGPTNRDRQNFVHTFQNVSGEVIFSLPNGLQGYMTVDGNGRRIDAASVKVTRDPHRRDGIVQNGLSCFGCHGGTGVLSPRQMDEVPLFADTHIAQFLGRELEEIESTYPRVLRPDFFLSDAIRYRNTAASSLGGAPPAEGAYAAFITALGHYESNVGFRGAAAEFNQDYPSLRQTILANDSQNESLPKTTSAPLVSRDDFVCVWRDLVTKIRPNAQFCGGTFNANQVRNLCDD